MAVKLRGLASIADSSGIADEVRPWVVKKRCFVRRAPANDGEIMGHVSEGERLIAAHTKGDFVKILNSTGVAAYVQQACGKFKEP